MIEINLLPGAGRKKASRGQAFDFKLSLAGLSARFADRFLIGAIAGVVVAIAAVGYLYTSQGSKAEALEAHRDASIRDSVRYANFLRDRYKAEAVRDTLLRQVNLIHNLDEDRYVWAHVFDEVDRALPQYTWLMTMGFTGAAQGANNVVVAPKTAADTSKKGKPPKRLDTEIPKDVIQVRLTGRTVDIQALTKYMRDLEVSPFLANVVLDKSEPAIDNGKEVMQFQLTLTYSRPDTNIIRRVPLSLSVK